MARALFLCGLVLSCASATSTAWEPLRRKPYQPGESIAEARICTCNECAERACCAGERETSDSVPEGELGLTLGGCGRCARRVWTVRGDASCESLAAPECCPGTVSD